MGFVIAHLLYAWAPVVYAAIFAGMVVEGEVFLFAGVFLAHQGVVSMFWIIIVAAAGLVLGDFFWYFSGRYLVHRFPFFERLSHRVSSMFDRHLNDRPVSTIVVSKFAYGIHRAVLIRAGQKKVSFRLFAVTIICIDAVWFGLVATLAIGLSAALGPVKHYLTYASIIVLAALLLFLFSERILAFVTERFIDRKL